MNQPKMLRWMSSIACFISLSLAGCNSIESGQTTTPEPSNPPAKVTLLAGSSEIQSDGKTAVTLTATVKDANNAALADEPVTFSTTDGGVDLLVMEDTTAANGTASAEIRVTTDKSARTVRVTAKAGAITSTLDLPVTGTTITTAGSSSTTISTPVTIMATLRDSSSETLANQPITVLSSSPNLTITSTQTTTDANGQFAVSALASQGGTYTVTFSALGVTRTHELTVSGDIFAVTADSLQNGASLEVDASGMIKVKWLQGGVPQASKNVSFSVTRGTINGVGGTDTVVTNASGEAQATLVSNSSGIATITVSATGGSPSLSQQITFITSKADKATLKANPQTIAVNTAGSEANKSTIMVTVADLNNNATKDALVNFSIVPNAEGQLDPSGGRLSASQAKTDINGNATIDYIAGTRTSGRDGVVIEATVISVAGNPVTGLKSRTSLTVSGQGLYVRLQTNNLLEESSDELKYKQYFTALVVDAAGNPVKGKVVQFSVKPVEYGKGSLSSTSGWGYTGGARAATCASEDRNLNGILDGSEDLNSNGILDAGEDKNQNGLLDLKEDIDGDDKLDPGGVTSITGISGSTTVTTDSFGFADAVMTYSKNYAKWVKVEVTATTEVNGDQSKDTMPSFWLTGLAKDYASPSILPPGDISPFGIVGNCSDPN